MNDYRFCSWYAREILLQNLTLHTGTKTLSLVSSFHIGDLVLHFPIPFIQCFKLLTFRRRLSGILLENSFHPLSIWDAETGNNT